MLKFDVTVPNTGAIRAAGQRFDRAEKQAVHNAVDKATRLARTRIQDKVRAVGLGRLANAVRANSSKSKRQQGNRNAWGAIYASRGDQSRGGAALIAYTQGATIRGRNVEWLAIATRALPKRVGRFRMTPDRYKQAGSPLGPLQFKRISRNRAILVAKKVTVSPKTGRARPDTGARTRSRVRQAEVVAFVLLRITKRAKRFDDKQIVRIAASQVPRFVEEELNKILAGRPETG